VSEKTPSVSEKTPKRERKDTKRERKDTACERKDTACERKDTACERKDTGETAKVYRLKCTFNVWRKNMPDTKNPAAGDGTYTGGGSFRADQECSAAG
jgi:hypothetical protein